MSVTVPDSLMHINQLFMTTTSTPSTVNQSFLEKVAAQGRLTSLYEAQEMAEIVFRTMRDLMNADLIERVENQLSGITAHTSENKTLQGSVADLWQDSNPLVGWLSRIRPPFARKAPGGINDQLFFTRVQREGGMPRTTTAPTVVKAVFTATKEELSDDCVSAIANCLPGKIRQLWQMA